MNDFYVATVDERLDGIADQIVADCPLMQRLKEAGGFEFGHGGDGFSFSARKSRSGIVHAVGDWTTGQAKTASVMQKIVAAYRQYAGAILLSRFQGYRNQYGANDSKQFDFFFESLNELEQDFAHCLATDFYADGNVAGDDEATPVDGLEIIVDSAGTYLGVDRSASTWWAAQENAVTNAFLDDDDGDGVVNGLRAMRLTWYQCESGDAGDEHVSKTLAERRQAPQITLCDRSAFELYAASLQPQQVYTNRSTNDPGQMLSFMGKPIEWDPYATALRFYMLNFRYLKARVVGPKLIYRDIEDHLGADGTPRADAIGLASQLQFYTRQPRRNGKVTYAT